MAIVVKKTLWFIYQTFLVLSSFTGFLYFVANFLPRIVSANKVFVLTWPSLLQNLIFWHLVHHQTISRFVKDNKKQVSCVKLPNLMVLCKEYLLYLVQVKNWLLGKLQILVETYAQTVSQSPFQKLNFGYSSQKHVKVDMKLSLSCPVSLYFSILFQMFCQGLYTCR